MDDQDASKTPSPQGDDRNSPLLRAKDLARRGGRLLFHNLQESIEHLQSRAREHLLELVGTPEQVEVIQETLIRLTSWSMDKGFRSDPNAELLFRFADWIEKRHSRPKITALLLSSPILRDPAFIDALMHSSKLLRPWESRDEDESWDLPTLDAFKARAGDRLLDLLVELAALEAGQTTTNRSRAARIEFFESAPIPEQFHRLARMTEGRDLLPRPPSRRAWLFRKFRGRTSDEEKERTALAAFIPGRNDPLLHFLVISTSFFFQSYFLRNLIEAIPELADALSQNLRNDSPEEIIDLKP